MSLKHSVVWLLLGSALGCAPEDTASTRVVGGARSALRAELSEEHATPSMPVRLALRIQRHHGAALSPVRVQLSGVRADELLEGSAQLLLPACHEACEIALRYEVRASAAQRPDFGFEIEAGDGQAGLFTRLRRGVAHPARPWPQTRAPRVGESSWGPSIDMRAAPR